ncbi:hypothetical protein DSO57_1038591 [Entomophthora muscae]|uniref:Uncharacterized protein n=1 Tax=Entomophthora muscae TaxID=34485 RepID=A0ACC2SYM7_9FUNG|nr:hypothetical protein DSO57_1038591 [Entomophthora muscae]
MAQTRHSLTPDKHFLCVSNRVSVLSVMIPQESLIASEYVLLKGYLHPNFFNISLPSQSSSIPSASPSQSSSTSSESPSLSSSTPSTSPSLWTTKVLSFSIVLITNTSESGNKSPQTLVEELNQFQEHTNAQFELVGARVDEWGNKLQQKYDVDKAKLRNTLHQVQKYVDEKVASMTVVLPTALSEHPPKLEAKIWEAISELNATTCCQSANANVPIAEPVPDTCIIILTDQVAHYNLKFLTCTNDSQIKRTLLLDLKVKVRVKRSRALKIMGASQV